MWQRLKKYYVRKSTDRWGASLSALAWERAQDGRPFWRNRIDGAWLLFGGVHNHCQASYQRERGDRYQPTDID